MLPTAGLFDLQSMWCEVTENGKYDRLKLSPVLPQEVQWFAGGNDERCIRLIDRDHYTTRNLCTA